MAAIDVELAIPQDGYPALADWIAADPDNETFIFRKFDRLGARNLLYLQSELFALEASLDELDREMCWGKDVGLRASSRRWETFVEKAKDQHRPEWKRMKLVREIRKALREYRQYIHRPLPVSDDSDTYKTRRWFFNQVS